MEKLRIFKIKKSLKLILAELYIITLKFEKIYYNYEYIRT